MMLLFLITVALSGYYGTLAKAKFIMLLRDQHPDLYKELDEPRIWINTSFSQGVRVQKLVFSKESKLCIEAERARIYLQRVTVAVISSLIIVLVLFAWSLESELSLGAIF